MVRILYCFSWLLFAYQVKTCECGEKLHAMDSGNKAFGTIRGRFILENGGFSEALRKELRIAPKGGVPEILFYLDPKVNVAIATPNEKHKLEKLTIKFWAIEEPFAFAC